VDAAAGRGPLAGPDPFAQARLAPAPLDLVQVVLNTRSLLRGFDDLRDLPSARRWLGESAPARRSGLAPQDLDEREMHALRALREAVRAAVAASGGPEDEPARSAPCDALAAAAAAVPLVVRLGDGGAPEVQPHADAPRVRGAVLAALATAPAEAWRRLKVCRNASCRWAFYDTSRNRAGAWCDMDVCGARAKMRRYRGAQA
jgi:predicted RNA-binding Zn ribbon-like protein